MIGQDSRFINSAGAPKEIPRLLQSLFVSELIAPSDCIWLVSPWISDIPIIDNRANTFVSLDHTWERTQVRLSQILCSLINSGTTVYVATRPDRHNQQFLRAIEDYAPVGWRQKHVHIVEELHEKGLLGSDYYLAGSMNFTYNGIVVLEESAHFHTEPAIVAEQRIKFRDRWGG